MSKNDTVYLTTRMVESRAKQAFSAASKQAMIDHGYIVVAKDGFIVKQFSDGTIEIIEEIVKSKIKLVLD